jgi:uncharacterized membrane protein YczE
MKKNTRLAARIAGVLAGVFLLGLGQSLLICTDLGIDPMGSLTLRLAELTGISYGTCMLLENLVLLLGEVIFARGMIGIGTLCNMTIVGYVSGYFTPVWQAMPLFQAMDLPRRLALLAVGLAVFIFAAAIYMAADLGLGAYDWPAVWIARRSPRLSFRAVRMLWDAGFSLAALLLGGRIGIVTVGIVLGLGPVVGAFGNWLAKKIYGVETLG